MGDAGRREGGQSGFAPFFDAARPARRRQEAKAGGGRGEDGGAGGFPFRAGTV